MVIEYSVGNFTLKFVLSVKTKRKIAISIFFREHRDYKNISLEKFFMN